MELTREEAIREHRKMWNWIANETKKRGCIVEKYDYFYENVKVKSIDLNDVPKCHCYLCQYGMDQLLSQNFSSWEAYDNRCKYCPLDWGSSNMDSHMCLSIGGSLGLFDLWDCARRTDNLDAAYLYAKQIAELPEIEDSEENTLNDNEKEN
jgi:hypothetical protein